MCTLSFIPLKSGSVITANRDESPLRNANSLRSYYSALDEEYRIAEEPLHGGTNIAIGRGSRTSVLLNGAFERHDMNKSYGLSRGIVLLKSRDTPDLFSFADHFDFKSIQPFTLIEITEAIREIRWDGNHIYRKEYDLKEPRIWASAQLYLPEAIRNREIWFAQFLESKEITPESIARFHFNAGNGDTANDLVMNRQGLVRTVSITQTYNTSGIQKIKHWNLVEDSEMDSQFELDLKNNT